jgi:hypothetical protein
MHLKDMLSYRFLQKKAYGIIVFLTPYVETLATLMLLCLRSPQPPAFPHHLNLPQLASPRPQPIVMPPRCKGKRKTFDPLMDGSTRHCLCREKKKYESALLVRPKWPKSLFCTTSVPKMEYNFSKSKHCRV